MNKKHNDRFAVDVEKRAANSRSRTLTANLKELLANSLDAGAKQIVICCSPALNRRRDRDGMRAFEIICEDDGAGCADLELLRTLGSSTSDLHPETRGRFGQGLIDVLAGCESAEIESTSGRLVIDPTGCTISAKKAQISGMVLRGLLRHPGDDFDGLLSYFRSVMLPKGTELRFNGLLISSREPIRTIERIRLQTVAYDPAKGLRRKFQRTTHVEIVPKFSDTPMIYELGIPVDDAPWKLPYDINVMQKTPLDVERDTLPGPYKESLVSQLIGPLSNEYAAIMINENDVPDEIKNNPQNVRQLAPEVQDLVVRTVTGTDRGKIVRRNPFDPDDTSEAAELEARHGKTPINTNSLPSGVRELVRGNPTVAATHNKLCKVDFKKGMLPPETPRQRACLRFYEVLATALVECPVKCTRVKGGNVVAAWQNQILALNIDFDFLWDDPLGEEAIAVILHECAHHRVSGHSIAFQDEVARLGGKLAGWVGENHSHWQRYRAELCCPDNATVDAAVNRGAADLEFESIET